MSRARSKSASTQPSIPAKMLEFASVKSWLEGIRHGQASANTKEIFARNFYYYCRLVGRNPDQLLAEREKEYLSQEKEVRFKAEDTFR